MPERVESSLLVVQDLVDASGHEWRPGDRASLARAAVRRAARERPQAFMVEFSTEPFDPEAEWFQAIEADYERRYAEREKAVDAEAENREKALRAELREQDRRSQPELEKAYKRQEAEKERREKERREQAKRERIENEMELRLGPHR